MSHFTRVRTEIDDPEFLRKGLEELGYAVREGGSVRGFQEEQQVDLVVEMESGYDIGLVRDEADDTFAIVADWWGVSGESRVQFSEKLQKEVEEVKERMRDSVKEAKRQIRQEFAEERAVSTLEDQGFEVTKREVEDDGTVRIVARR